MHREGSDGRHGRVFKREETVILTGRILAEVPTHNVARRYRAAAFGHLGRVEDANALIADLLGAQPSSESAEREE